MATSTLPPVSHERHREIKHIIDNFGSIRDGEQLSYQALCYQGCQRKNENNHYLCPYESCDGKEWRQLCNYKVHLRQHIDERPYKCDQCAQCFRQQSHLSGHIAKMHTVVVPKACNFCDRSFKTTHSLSKHVRRRHSTNQQRQFMQQRTCHERSTDKTVIDCRMCGVEFNDVTTYSQHVCRRLPLPPKRINTMMMRVNDCPSSSISAVHKYYSNGVGNAAFTVPTSIRVNAPIMYEFVPAPLSEKNQSISYASTVSGQKDDSDTVDKLIMWAEKAMTNEEPTSQLLSMPEKFPLFDDSSNSLFNSTGVKESTPPVDINLTSQDDLITPPRPMCELNKRNYFTDVS